MSSPNFYVVNDWKLVLALGAAICLICLGIGGCEYLENANAHHEQVQTQKDSPVR